MKQKMVCAACAVFLMVSFSGCSSAPKVKRVEAGEQRDLSGRWSANDVRAIAGKLLDDCLGSPGVNRQIQDWKRSNRNENPTCIVGNFRNSSSEHIDTNILSRSLETAILNSGVLDFVAGGNVRDQIRTERQEQQVNASEKTAAALGNETGATFMLSGDVKSMIDQAGNKSYRNYFVDAQLTNIETGRIVWQGQAEVAKEIKQPGARF